MHKNYRPTYLVRSVDNALHHQVIEVVNWFICVGHRRTMCTYYTQPTQNVNLTFVYGSQ